ncbi:hypothetical protein ACC760_38705, partial [Rhizobium ruizarguesonis]
GETLLPLIDAEPDSAVAKANVVIKSSGERFQAHWLAGMREKIGLAGEEYGDLDLVQALLSLMQAQGAEIDRLAGDGHIIRVHHA